MDRTRYGPSQLGPSLPSFGFLVLPKTFLRTRSPCWKNLGRTFLLYPFFSCYWQEANLIIACSLLSSSRSRAWDWARSFLIGSHSKVLKVGRPISSGMTASKTQASENGVSPVDLRDVVLKVHKTLGNSSTHLPLASSSPFLIPSSIVLLDALACPLLYGYASEL